MFPHTNSPELPIQSGSATELFRFRHQASPWCFLYPKHRLAPSYARLRVGNHVECPVRYCCPILTKFGIHRHAVVELSNDKCHESFVQRFSSCHIRTDGRILRSPQRNGHIYTFRTDRSASSEPPTNPSRAVTVQWPIQRTVTCNMTFRTMWLQVCKAATAGLL
jgi:hypothetical protein